jgi:hypothetical protein
LLHLVVRSTKMSGINAKCLLIYIGMIQPEHATLKGLENLDLSDLTLGVDWAFSQVGTAYSCIRVLQNVF